MSHLKNPLAVKKKEFFQNRFEVSHPSTRKGQKSDSKKHYSRIILADSKMVLNPFLTDILGDSPKIGFCSRPYFELWKLTAHNSSVPNKHIDDYKGSLWQIEMESFDIKINAAEIAAATVRCSVWSE